jgi:hypothetical protein
MGPALLIITTVRELLSLLAIQADFWLECAPAEITRLRPRPISGFEKALFSHVKTC